MGEEKRQKEGEVDCRRDRSIPQDEPSITHYPLPITFCIFPSNRPSEPE
jgi:hypothetical protein